MSYLINIYYKRKHIGTIDTTIKDLKNKEYSSLFKLIKTKQDDFIPQYIYFTFLDNAVKYDSIREYIFDNSNSRIELIKKEIIGHTFLYYIKNDKNIFNKYLPLRIKGKEINKI